MTIAELQGKFDQLQGNWLGQAVDIDGVFNKQCTDFVKLYARDVHGIAPGTFGNAIQWWTQTSPALLTQFDRISTDDIKKGDIVILYTNGRTDYSGYGHVGLGTGKQTGDSFELLEQNGSTGNGSGVGGDAIRTRMIPKTRIAGVLRPKTQEVAPGPAIVVKPYTIQPRQWKQIKLNKATHKWGMNYDNFPAMSAHPEGSIEQGKILTVKAICYHNLGTAYYLEDETIPSGYNLADCDDYTPPVIAPPAAPITIPSTEQYEVLTEVPGYTTSNQAANHIKPTVKVPPRMYYVYYRSSGMINVSRESGKAGAWINPSDNVVPEVVPEPVAVVEPVPMVQNNVVDVSPNSVAATSDRIPNQVLQTTPVVPVNSDANNDGITTWQESYIRFPDGQRIYEYYAPDEDALPNGRFKPYTITDLSGVYPDITQQLNDAETIRVQGVFHAPDGVKYGRVGDKAGIEQNGWWYGVPASRLAPPQYVVKEATEKSYDIIVKLKLLYRSIYDKLVDYLESKRTKTDK